MPFNPFRGGIRPPDRRANANALERLDDAEAGRAGFVGRDENVARMQAAVADPCGTGKIDGAGDLRDERKNLLRRRGCVVAHRDVERLSRDVFLRAVGERPLDPGRQRLDNRWVEQRRLSRGGERVRERLRLFGNDVEPEDLDGDEAVAGRLVSAENGSQRANPNLVQHPERTECRGRRKGAGVLSCQRRTPRGESYRM